MLRAALVACLLILGACARAEDAAPEQSAQTAPALKLAATTQALPFDYWVLALSWSPQYCNGNQQDPQCERPYGFVVHGLWPQYEVGFPKDCGRGESVSRDLVSRMLPIMPSVKLIQHEWRKHGVCSTLSMEDYFSASEHAYHNVVIPQMYRNPNDYISTTSKEIQRQFLQANPGLTEDRISVQCSGQYLREVRVCYDKNFEFRACGRDVNDRCRAQVVLRPSR